ncbi:phage holin family protein [Ferruginibacter sp. SUN106]|uniref:phage holin family protein n=1 Tax=Ferruginibacter sp. SUN106 TaxID=2978348 RepID=UPI003D35DB5C
MEKAFAKAEELAGTIKEYINTTIESAKLNAAEKSSALIANTMARVLAAMVFIFFIVFAGIALALGLGEWLNKTWAGFLIVAFLYLLLGVLLWTAREKLLRLPIMNAFIKQLFKAVEDEEN